MKFQSDDLLQQALSGDRVEAWQNGRLYHAKLMKLLNSPLTLVMCQIRVSCFLKL